MSHDHPLAGPIYTVPPEPESCTTCRRGQAFMRATQGPYATAECSHVECPHRKSLTAQRHEAWQGTKAWLASGGS